MKKLIVSFCALAMLSGNIQKAQSAETVGTIMLAGSAMVALTMTSYSMVGPYSQAVVAVQNDIAAYDATGVMTLELEVLVDELMVEYGLSEEEVLNNLAEIQIDVQE